MTTQVALMAVFLPVVMLSVFTFVSIAVWTDGRRREREAFYHHETIRKVAESGSADGALSVMREQERIATQRRREGQLLGGVINVGVGAGLMIFLARVSPEAPVYLVGLIPIFVGLALLVYAGLLARKA